MKIDNTWRRKSIVGKATSVYVVIAAILFFPRGALIMPEHEKQIFSPLPESTGIRPQQIMVKAVIARGGNSRGVYLLRSQLPADTALRDKIILAGHLW